MADEETTENPPERDPIPISELKSRTFTIGEKLILHSLEPVVEAIAQLFGNGCEVTLCSLERWDHAIIKVVNGHVTGREVGSPLTNLELKILRNQGKGDPDVVNTYFVQSDHGDIIKATKAIIRNADDVPIGMVSINLNLSVPFIDLIAEMTPTVESLAPVKPIRYPATPHELVKQSLEIVLSELKKSKKLSQTERNKRIVLEMLDIGIFDIRGAVDLIAKEMGVSRYTIYNYIREAKSATEE